MRETSRLKSTPVPSHPCFHRGKLAPAKAGALMARFQARGDCDAFEQIVSSCLSPALAVARQILSDHALAEDAVQESFLRVIRKREQYIPGSPFSCWFYAIVRNVCVDMLRRRARQKEAIEQISARDVTRHSSVVTRRTMDDGGWTNDDRRTDLSEISKLLDVLTSGERDVLVLRIVHGLGFRDVAAALGISEEAAKKRAQRALRRLRAKICVSPCYGRLRPDEESSPGKLSVAL